MRRSVVLAIMVLLPSFAARADEPATETPALWGKPTVNGGACCETLAQVRTNIDRLDREIIRLMAERGEYVHEAARFKANPAQVEAPERAEAVIQKARALAQQDGLSPDVAEATYRALVRAFIDYEHTVFTKDGKGG